MSTPMEEALIRPAYLNEIPFDIKDIILAFIDQPRHLLSMALASKAWAELIIPNHIEYRILRLPLSHSNLWDHLSLRTDLSKTVHTVRFATYEGNISKLSLCDTETRMHVDEDIPYYKIYQALRDFRALKSITWTRRRWQTDPSTELPRLIFRALVQCHHLEELQLGQICTEIANSDVETLWQLSNIKRLTLEGALWARCISNTSEAFAAFLKNLSELKELTISYYPASPVFTSCVLPKLKKLHLWPVNGAGAANGQGILSADSDMLRFLEAHPSIEDIHWLPIEPLILPLGLLPSLKRLYTTDHIAKSLLRDNTAVPERKIEAISQISLGPMTLRLLQKVNGAYLQELRLWRFDDLDQVQFVGELFPNIRKLDIPKFVQLDRNTMDEFIDTLACFPRLEHFLDSSLWLAIIITQVEGSPHKTMNKLAAKCPCLKTLRHWKWTINSNWNVVIHRNLDHENEVTWEEQEDN